MEPGWQEAEEEARADLIESILWDQRLAFRLGGGDTCPDLTGPQGYL